MTTALSRHLNFSSYLVARDPMARLELPHLRNFLLADVACDRTSGMEHAPGGRGQGRRNLAAQRPRSPRTLDPRVRDRRRIQQGLGIGVQRALIDLVTVG